MADRMEEQILVKVQTLLNTQNVDDSWPTAAESDVFRDKTTTVSEDTDLPVMNILQGPIRPLAAKDGFLNLAFIDSEMDFYIDLVVHTTDVNGAGADTAANALWTQIHITIFKDGITDLGMAPVFVIFPSGADEPIPHSEVDRQYVTMRTHWTVRYRTSLADPTKVS